MSVNQSTNSATINSLNIQSNAARILTINAGQVLTIRSGGIITGTAAQTITGGRIICRQGIQLRTDHQSGAEHAHD